MKKKFYIISLFLSFFCCNAEASRLYAFLSELSTVTSRALSRTLAKHYDPVKFPTSVDIVEVSPRDGLQNECHILTVEERLTFMNFLEESGLSSIEGGAFVSPKFVPQMANSFEVAQHLFPRESEVSYPFLVPNLKGLEQAIKAGVNEIAVFTSPSTEFTQKNIGMSVGESLEIQREVARQAIAHNIWVRGYVSCVMGCPYEGEMDPRLVRTMAEEMLGFGCYQISLGDTIGVGTPKLTERLIRTVILEPGHDPDLFAAHFHDTNELALANLVVALNYGISTIDSSVGGLGACPYAMGATGNVATERVVCLLDVLNIETGVDLGKLERAKEYAFAALYKNATSFEES